MKTAMKFAPILLAALASVAMPAMADDDRGGWRDRGNYNQGDRNNGNDRRGRNDDNDRRGRNDDNDRGNRGQWSRGDDRRDRGHYNGRGDHNSSRYYNSDRRYDYNRNQYRRPVVVQRPVVYHNSYRGYPSHRSYQSYRGYPSWARGRDYRSYGYNNVYYVPYNDYGRYNLYNPHNGYRWVRDDRGNFLMVAIATGIISSILLNHHAY